MGKIRCSSCGASGRVSKIYVFFIEITNSIKTHRHVAICVEAVELELSVIAKKRVHIVMVLETGR
jgi:hypothetical protein